MGDERNGQHSRRLLCRRQRPLLIRCDANDGGTFSILAKVWTIWFLLYRSTRFHLSEAHLTVFYNCKKKKSHFSHGETTVWRNRETVERKHCIELNRSARHPLRFVLIIRRATVSLARLFECLIDTPEPLVSHARPARMCNQSYTRRRRR